MNFDTDVNLCIDFFCIMHLIKYNFEKIVNSERLFRSFWVVCCSRGPHGGSLRLEISRSGDEIAWCAKLRPTERFLIYARELALFTPTPSHKSKRTRQCHLRLFYFRILASRAQPHSQSRKRIRRLLHPFLIILLLPS